MKAKRRIIAFLFSILMIWQGYSFAKAEGEVEMPLFIAESSAENAETAEIEERARENLNSSEELSERRRYHLYLYRSARFFQIRSRRSAGNKRW